MSNENLTTIWHNNRKRVGRATAVFLFLALFGLLMGSGAGTAVAQQPVTPLYSQNFDSIGTAQIATLPANWRADKHTTERTLGTWAAAGTVTEQRSGDNMSQTAQNGIYNFGAGVPATATDRAIGWVSSASATKSGNLYVHLENNTGTPLNSISVAYDVEKYRNGTNAAGFSIQLYYSTDGSNWTSAGSTFLTSFPGGDAANTGFTPAPGETRYVVGTLTFSAPIAVDGEFYLAWNYSVTTGTTTSNAQALAVDNVVVSPTTISNLTPDDTPAWLNPGWQFWGFAATSLGQALCVEVHPVGDPSNYIRSRCEFDNTNGPDGANWACEVFTSGVPSAFYSGEVEYQFFLANYDDGSSCPGGTEFTGFNWSFETGPTAVTLSSFSPSNTNLPLLLLVVFGLLVGGTAVVAHRRKA